ncbi:protein FAR-RED IMPAIRED RESPONSE 1-like [Alnus glutinosa]|uniref:protein FAR-RED IMPAIRED RESPONSE 1-like n=1 Tax=Alnus glutinosa TaxID=3517 RepID=UPI002D77EB1C|nr:protein FAR-RED IMPAIRED RESPONSE 1-like [Alnus glutinosa]
MIFKKFHDEYDYASAAIIKHRSDSQAVHEYIVGIFNEGREYKVVCDHVNKIISCSCRKFETFGILCCHALKIFDLLDIKIIPDAYILKRWTREAKSEYILNTTSRNVEENINLNGTQRYRRLCPMLVELATEAADNEKACAFVERMVKEMKQEVQNIKKGSSAALNNEDQLLLSNGNEIANHSQSVEKLLETVKGFKKKEGRKSKKRAKSWVEMQPNNRRKSIAKDSVGKNYSQQIDQVPYSIPRVTFEEPFQYRCETSFINFLPEPFDRSSLPLSSEVSNNAYVNQRTSGFNLTPTFLADSTNENLDLRNFLGH